ncbi:hypothetical protein LTR12_007074 [Friedmanniomyces endolithicus]|nr:hypothetical protein LTR74_008643 [Friedmanniomyces endolithicus]KAK1818515.1 hypothetical protein LTR12_007074 [Friedmanniomyces endolithicus]
MPKAEVDAHLKEAELIYCCTRSLRDGLRSGLEGSLQKHGYTEENRRIMVKPFDATTQMVFYLNGGQQARSYDLHWTVSSPQVEGLQTGDSTICTEVIEEFQQMELSTVEKTLGVESRRKAEETAPADK